MSGTRCHFLNAINYVFNRLGLSEDGSLFHMQTVQ